MKFGLFTTIEKLYPSIHTRVKIVEPLENFSEAETILSLSTAIITRDQKQPGVYLDLVTVQIMFSTKCNMNFGSTNAY